ncbi:MAG: succinate dehydrogenase / fumarate reductase, cytochrome b subunit [Clostridia bacterium]|nr:succinate dehydrogenase / fumarate reductase, cytochrome b subunit [Clostridia bacterium]
MRYNNRLGAKGWVIGGNYSIERYLYILHRVSGLALIFYLMCHLILTSFRIAGAPTWEAAMAFVSGPFFKVGEFLVMCAGVYHAINGLRLIIIELGYCIGKPERQEYPYTPSIKKQRPLMYLLMLVVAALVAVSVVDFFIM